ncbi:MAG: serpin family protein [Infirmifilum sp.]|jgi:serpin B
MSRLKLIVTALLVSLFISLIAIFFNMAPKTEHSQPPATVMASPLDSYTGFAIRFSLKSGLGQRNTVVSPYSVYMALLMLSEGASGQTRSELLTALGLSSLSDAREWFKESTGRFLACSTPTKTSIANSIWVKKGVPVRDSFVKTLVDYYMAEKYTFTDTNSAVKDINEWVSDKTQGLIKEILKQLDESSVVVLVNTVYFKSNWTTPFENEYKDLFFSPKGTVETEFMSGTVPAVTIETEDYTAVMLGYKGTDIKFVILMPRKTGLKEFMEGMTSEKLISIFTELATSREENIKLSMPRFDVDSGILEVKPVLKEMGISNVFTPEADLSAMIDTSKILGNVYVDDVFHRARVKVDTEGTEAAAATAVVVRVTAVPLQVKAVKIDRPFAFFLIDPQTKAIIFAGSFVQP